MKWLYGLVLALLLVASPAYADYDEGAAAFKREDYATALRELRPLAEQGDPRAQNNLGVMYYRGAGVPQDYAEAVKWYRAAAEQGYASAQANLSHMYAWGSGVPKDYVLAHMWSNLAAAWGDKKYTEYRDLIVKFMTSEQIDEAWRLARRWKPRK
jgi:hypothetical protein